MDKLICNTPMPQKLHIALGFDKNYIVFVHSMLASVLLNNIGEKIVFHIIPNDMAENDKVSLLNYISTYNCEVIFHTLGKDMLNRKLVFPSDTHFNIATYYRLFFPTLVSCYTDRLLYLDADLTVLGNLRELYNKNMGDYAIAAVSDPYVVTCERLDITEENGYFNAGVMLIDINNWNRQEISERALNFIERFPEKIKFCDQDALNAVLATKWMKLSDRFNLTQFAVKLQVPAKMLIKNVLIVHYTSHNKPWNALTRNKLRYLYHHYLKLSPMKDENKYVDFKWNIKNLWTFSRIRFKEFYFNYKIDKILHIKKWDEPSWNY